MKTEKDFILKALQAGTMSLEGQFVYGSNHTFLVDCHYQELNFKAVYKPLQGERPLLDFPHQTLSRREVAAFLVSEALGWELVPPTVFRTTDAPLGPGSAQLFIEHDPEYHYFVFREEDKVRLSEVMLFDLLINNADRKSGHLLIDPEGKLWLIDHGLSFHEEDKLRTVIWDHAGKPIPENLRKDVETLIPKLSPGGALFSALTPRLLPGEIKALESRARLLAGSDTFPLPPEDRRAYPWPLV